jgi:hypothetical protein
MAENYNAMAGHRRRAAAPRQHGHVRCDRSGRARLRRGPFEMQDYIPGTSFVERSRSGNAHVWVFFSEPLEAWVAMGILKEATKAAGKDHVEVFPKNHDFAKVKLGNYINLPYHGSDRPIIPRNGAARPDWTLEMFLHRCARKPSTTRGVAQARSVAAHQPPEERESRAEFGTQTHLHMCAEHIISGRGRPDHARATASVVYFSLAKMLTNWEQMRPRRGVDILRSVNEMLA